MIQIRILIILGLTAVLFFSGWKTRGWYEDSQDKKVIIDKVEGFNEGTKEIEIVVKEVEKIKYVDREKIIRLPATIVNAECPDDPSTTLRNEAYRSINKSLFQSTD